MKIIGPTEFLIPKVLYSVGPQSPGAEISAGPLKLLGRLQKLRHPRQQTPRRPPVNDAVIKTQRKARLVDWLKGVRLLIPRRHLLGRPQSEPGERVPEKF